MAPPEPFNSPTSLSANPAMRTPFFSWKVVQKDPVNYIDTQRRGLQFVFGLVRDIKNGEFNSPMNKDVSVYMKPNDDGDGDFVVVSKTGNNPNDVRIFEMTNEQVNEIGGMNDPLELVRKVIEMADDSGMTRNLSEYGDYGGLNSHTSQLEIADGGIFDAFKAKMGIKDRGETRTGSVVKAAAGAQSNKKAQEAVLQTSTAVQQDATQPPVPAGPSLGKRIGKAMAGAAGTMAHMVASTAATNSAKTVGPLPFLHKAAANILTLGGKSRQDAKAQQEAQKHQYRMTELGAKMGATAEITQMKTQGAVKVAQVTGSSRIKTAEVRQGALTGEGRKNYMATQQMHQKILTSSARVSTPQSFGSPAGMQMKTPTSASGVVKAAAPATPAYPNPYQSPAATKVKYGKTTVQAGKPRKNGGTR